MTYDEIINLHSKRMKLANRTIPNKNKRDRHCIKIRSKATDLVTLLSNFDVSPIVSEEFMEELTKLTETQASVQISTGIKYFRTMLFIRLFTDCWDGEKPKSEDFIDLCHKAINEAGDNLVWRTVRDMIMEIPIPEFTDR